MIVPILLKKLWTSAMMKLVELDLLMRLVEGSSLRQMTMLRRMRPRSSLSSLQLEVMSLRKDLEIRSQL
jgi:hypothetical protein